jgi:hypothetical protein
MEYNYQLKHALLTDTSVEDVKFDSYTKSDKTVVPEVTKPVYFAENGDAYPCTGRSKTRITYFVRTPIIEVKAKKD